MTDNTGITAYRETIKPERPFVYLDEFMRLKHEYDERIAELEAENERLETESQQRKERIALAIAHLEAENQRLRSEFYRTWYALKNDQVSIGDRIDNALKILEQTMEDGM